MSTKPAASGGDEDEDDVDMPKEGEIRRPRSKGKAISTQHVSDADESTESDGDKDADGEPDPDVAQDLKGKAPMRRFASVPAPDVEADVGRPDPEWEIEPEDDTGVRTSKDEAFVKLRNAQAALDAMRGYSVPAIPKSSPGPIDTEELMLKLERAQAIFAASRATRLQKEEAERQAKLAVELANLEDDPTDDVDTAMDVESAIDVEPLPAAPAALLTGSETATGEHGESDKEAPRDQSRETSPGLTRDDDGDSAKGAQYYRKRFRIANDKATSGLLSYAFNPNADSLGGSEDVEEQESGAKRDTVRR